MCSISQHKAPNVDDESNNKKVAALFEDSGSEEDSEKEIKTTVDRIVQESDQKAGDQTNSEGAVVEVLNNHIMTLINQNHAVTNEILEKIKSLEESQSEILRRIEGLVNPVVNLTPQDIPEQHEPLLTMFTPVFLNNPSWRYLSKEARMCINRL